MIAADLFAQFECLADSTAAVRRLRSFALDLAVRGVLSTHDSTEEPASEILLRIREEKLRLDPKRAPLSEITREEVPFVVPDGWEWVRLGLLMIENQKMLDPQHRPETRFCLWSVPSFSQGKPELLRGDEIGSSKREINSGDILLSKINPHLNRVWLTEGYGSYEHIASSEWIVLTTFGISRKLIKYFLTSPYFLNHFCSDLTGIGGSLTRVRPAVARTKVLPIPPLSEQERIVAKVDELMKLCNELEAAQSERETSRDRLTLASSHRFREPESDSAAFWKHSKSYLANFEKITARPDQVAELSRVILNLAVRGRLVPQDQDDEPTHVLLERIGAKASDDGTFSVPTSWSWITVGEIGDRRLGKMLDKAKNKGSLKRYLRNANVRWFDFDLSDVLEMRFEDSELDKFELRQGDIMICEGGEPGRAAVWDEREEDIYFQKAIHRVRFVEGVSPHFFVNALRESADADRLTSHFTGVTIKHLTGKGLSSFTFPLPPLAEQHRIVAKVDELVALCNELEESLTTAQTQRSRLLEAVLHEALASVA